MAASSSTCTPARSPETRARSSATCPRRWGPLPMFTDAQQHALVAIARAAVTETVTGRHVDTPDPGALPEASGAFVTLKRDGLLRGCIGTLECRRPLAEEIARVAVSAAREDPRFEPVRVAELDGLDVEVS